VRTNKRVLMRAVVRFRCFIFLLRLHC
jgi:hypothetical protein